jgi:hypothetical protein
MKNDQQLQLRRLYIPAKHLMLDHGDEVALMALKISNTGFGKHASYEKPL